MAHEILSRAMLAVIATFSKQCPFRSNKLYSTCVICLPIKHGPWGIPPTLFRVTACFRLLQFNVKVSLQKAIRLKKMTSYEVCYKI